MGRTGSGKSTHLRAMRDTFPDEDGTGPGHVILVDPKNEHADPINGARYFADPNADMVADAPAYGLVERRVAEAFHRGSCMVICDELDLAIGRGQQGPLSPVRVVMHGRHRDVSYVWACRRPAELPRSYTSQATEFCFYALSEPADVEYAYKRGVPKGWLQRLSVGQHVHLTGDGTPHIHNSPTEWCGHRRMK